MEEVAVAVEEVEDEKEVDEAQRMEEVGEVD